MLPHEVARIVAKQEEKSEKAPKLKIDFREGDRVKINEGTFENFEGEVDSIDETNGRVTVMINIFGRSTPVELEYWQIEAIVERSVVSDRRSYRPIADCWQPTNRQLTLDESWQNN